MEILYLIIPISVILIFFIIWVFLWAVKHGQFDDMEGPAHRILMDDDSSHTEPSEEKRSNEV